MKKLLVVDNEVEISQLLTTRLTILGYKVFLVSSGTDALKVFNQENIEELLNKKLLEKNLIKPIYLS